MDRALWLLLWLRCQSWLRRGVRALGSVKGSLLVLLGLLVFLPWAASMWFGAPPPDAEQLERVRRLGPLVLLAYCLLTLLLSTGEQGISFRGPEVDFLFPAPFSRRELLLYKILGSSATAVVSALFLTMAFRRNAARADAAFVGIALGLIFMQLFTLALSLFANAIGTQLYTRRRKLVLIGIGGVLAAGLLWINRGAPPREWIQTLPQVAEHPIARVLLSPLRPFVEALTAEKAWPDLALWSALAALVLVPLLAVIFLLDAHFLEGAVLASEKTHAALQRLRSGGATASTRTASRFSKLTLPMLPRWFGAGSLAWRQLLTVPRSRGPYVLAVMMVILICGPLFAVVEGEEEELAPAVISLGVILAFPLALASIIPYDFRADLDRLDVLKSLPISAVAVAVGEVLTPALLTTAMQGILIILVWSFSAPEPLHVLAVAAAMAPANLLLFGMENLFFLWFPSRISPSTPGDLQNLGRHLLLFLAKVVGLGLVVTLGSVFGGAAYWLTGKSVICAAVVAWMSLVACAIALMPILAMAFEAVDVNRDVPP